MKTSPTYVSFPLGGTVRVGMFRYAILTVSIVKGVHATDLHCRSTGQWYSLCGTKCVTQQSADSGIAKLHRLRQAQDLLVRHVVTALVWRHIRHLTLAA